MKYLIGIILISLLASCGDALDVQKPTSFNDQFGQGKPIKIEEIGLEVMSKDLCFTNWKEPKIQIAMS